MTHHDIKHLQGRLRNQVKKSCLHFWKQLGNFFGFNNNLKNDQIPFTYLWVIPHCLVFHLWGRSSSPGLEHYASSRKNIMLLVHRRCVCILVQYLIHGISKDCLKTKSFPFSIHSLDDFSYYLAEQVKPQSTASNSCSPFRQALLTEEKKRF